MILAPYHIAILIGIFSTSAMAMSNIKTCGNRLMNQRVLVTGAGRGIGQAIAVICSKEGAKVAIASRNIHELSETAEMMDGERSIHVTDLHNEEQVHDMVESIASKWGGFDVLINNAGGAQPTKGSFETLKSDDLSRLLDLNVVTVHRVSSKVVNHMKEGGRIINISSRAGKVGLPSMSFYVASKFALEGLTATMAEDLKERKILVNTLSPGMVNTKSFPKPDGRPGVRSADSVYDGLFTLLDADSSGHYLHVDELDEAREHEMNDAVAIKPINEPKFLSRKE
mmetsp:Transcript_2348/g.3477  ORF Transcript_2348/g.3477 Transcript_2348/m.3477 type:complete len:283 (+) Transcript_2348:221-1069(+)|eukprot:CAMPEP_0194203428 /NCGR_PEP_ID=MMETSP0156-20130528/3208_1 /TAXON_ID=33649 /ORGANISM="Thalassionema nitzschioides, Strain L26-B" /LENGTH=282 /DNA_ID=CAMNT_0038929177 /DNA_START=217 /DNA_END=1065 /DNA_ORIENTATION=+